MIAYDDNNLQRILEIIQTFKDKFLGGTEIYEPLKEIFDLKKKGSQKIKDQKWNIFLLTDGEVKNTDAVIDLIH